MHSTNFSFRSKVFSLLFVLVAVVIVFATCKKKDETTTTTPTTTTTTLTNNPTAMAEFDNNAGGIYKGIVTGSSGYVYIYFRNKSNLIYAILNFDGVYDSLVCPALSGYTLPGADITNAMFLSALGKQDTILFSVKGNGTNPSMIVKIPGHDTKSEIRKETSKEELRVYTGNIFDTLVAGYYYCGSSTVTTIGSVRQSHITIMLQGNTAVMLPSRHLPPCESFSMPSAFVLQVTDGKIEFEEPGPPKKKNKFTITDATATGTSICIPPIDMGGEIDAYNSSITATRVK